MAKVPYPRDCTDMPELDILPTPRDVDVVSPSYASHLFHHSSKTPLRTQHKTLFPEKSSSARMDGADDDRDIIIPGLPPLLHGHPDVHLRNGVIRSARLAAAGEPDAERAYFVADLSQVYRQHDRWKRLLPEIEPFYGAGAPSCTCSIPADVYVRSGEM